jgi:hypothetical protein
VGTLDRITCPAIAVVEFVVSQVGYEVDASWHVPVLQLHAATPYDTPSLPYLEPAPSVVRYIGSAGTFPLHLRHASIGEEFGSGDKAAVV